MGAEVDPEVLGAGLRASSRSLAEVMDRDERVGPLLHEAILPDPGQYRHAVESALAADALPGLRAEKRRRLLQIAALDLAERIVLEDVGRALSDLADACLSSALTWIEAPEGLAVIGMGKLGGRELNYCSDIDLMFVTDGEVNVATDAATRLLAALGEFAPEGQAYRIDVDLRPEGRSGVLVRSLEGFLEYYRRWAGAWEFQALIKARAAAGNDEFGRRFIDQTQSFVYPDEIDADRIGDIRAMKKRVERHSNRRARVARGLDADDVKLGPGGIRDIEFSVQLLQLVHGGSDPSVRGANTLASLDALVGGGYVAEDDGAGLAVAYRWLRTVEHRLQLWQERPVHRLPQARDDRARIARVMGFRDTPASSALEAFEIRHAAVLADVRGRFEKLFYRPMIEALAGAGPQRLSHAALIERLRVLGFRDVERAARTLDGLVSGTSRRAKLFRILTPPMLRFLATSPLPDEGLFSFLKLGEALEDRVDALGALRDNPPGIELLARVLGSGRLLGEILRHVPEEVAEIARGTDVPRAPDDDRERSVREAMASLAWRDPAGRLDGLRRFKRRAWLEIALDDLGGLYGADDVGRRLANVGDACLEAALDGKSPPLAVIGMGKFGGRELSYASDIDVMFVHASEHAPSEKVAEALLEAIGGVTPEGQAFEIDASIRPEGKAGPLVRSLDSYLEYYRRWAKAWEFQALIKARAAAGDRALGDRFVAATRELAFPDRVPSEALAEVRHLKARMERERIPRGTDPRRHFKLGPGGLSDVEFAVQVLQLRHGAEARELQVGRTVDALHGAVAAGVLQAADEEVLQSSYRFLSEMRNKLFFISGRPTDVLPPKPEGMEALGIAMGYESQPRQELEEEYLRVTRRCRKVAEPIIFGR
jgi:[glutamine synthetase] adenylyltransferase / [glutamine synthetase]-adenylyl-L-tyrosine phosphorylase